MGKVDYKPQEYWNEVAKRIAERETGNIIAGDDEPYYRYKRKRFLHLFSRIQFKDKKVLEIGSGPGGNLVEVLKREPRELHGLDISDEMVKISSEKLKNTPVNIEQIRNQKIHFPGNYFDLSFTSTVLQHNTDPQMLENIIDEICRVTNNEIFIFERIEKKIIGNELNYGRPVEEYERLFNKNNFKIEEVKFLNIHVSYLVSGSIRKLFNGNKKEGEPMNGVSKVLQKITLPITSTLDQVFKVKRDLAMIHFKRKD